jgi:hypothetical protein
MVSLAHAPRDADVRIPIGNASGNGGKDRDEELNTQEENANKSRKKHSKKYVSVDSSVSPADVAVENDSVVRDKFGIAGCGDSEAVVINGITASESENTRASSKSGSSNNGSSTNGSKSSTEQGQEQGVEQGTVVEFPHVQRTYPAKDLQYPAEKAAPSRVERTAEVNMKEKPTAKSEKQSEHRPILAALHMNVVTIGQSANWLCIKIIYIHYPLLSGFQILMFRSIICTLATFLFVAIGGIQKEKSYTGAHSALKEALIDAVPRDQYFNLFLRCMQGLTVKSLQFCIFKYWKLTTISMVVSLGPIFTVIGGMIFLKESVTASDMVQMALSVVAIGFVTMNSLEDHSEIQEDKREGNLDG